MSQDSLRSSMVDVVVSGKPLGGTRVETFDVGKPIPNLRSSEDSLAFPNIDLSGVGEDIPGGLMTVLTPEETGSGALDSSYGTQPISGSK